MRQGALPDFQSSSRCSRSRWVSIAYQKPRCSRNTQLAVPRKAYERVLFQYASFVFAEVFEDFALEEKISTINPVVGKIRLFREFDDLIMFQFQLANRDGGLTPQTVATSSRFK